MKFQTQSGSVYEIDVDKKMIRRLKGMTNPTPLQNKEGVWRKYDYIFPNVVTMGKILLILWSEDVPKSANSPSTLTSNVVLISNE